MTPEEKELETLVRNINADEPIRFPPIFEMYITLFSIALSVLLFLFPEMLVNQSSNIYDWMMKIMSQNMWATTFLVAGLLKATGLLIDNRYLRYIGLVLSVVVYLTLTVCYSLVFPTMGAIQFGCITLFTILSIPVVKHTGLDGRG